MSVRKRRSGNRDVWIVDIDIQYPDGRRAPRVRKVSPVQTKRGAEQYERDLRESILSGDYKREEEQVPTLEKFSEEFLVTYAETNNKPSEVEAKKSILRSWLLPELGAKRLDDIGMRESELLKAKMRRKGLSAKRVNNTITVLNRLLKYAEEIELIDQAPRLRFVRVPPPDFDFLTFEEYPRLVDGAEEEPAVRAAILTAGDAGLRSGEMRALKKGRVDFVARQLTVAETFWRNQLGSPKGGRIGRLDMTQALTEALRSQRHLRGEFVFCDEKGVPWTRDWADAALRRQCRRAGLREIGWHVLRHTFCSHLAMQGAPAKAIMELARHTSLGVTQRYMHLSPDARRDAIDLLDARPLRHHSGTADPSTDGSSRKHRG